jgi:hypothetical protein
LNQNCTSRLVTGVPSDQSYRLSVIVAVVWPPVAVMTAGSARLSAWFRPTCPGLPNQYSGRHIRYSEYSRLAPVDALNGSSGNIQVN